jgi:hypothetical protein
MADVVASAVSGVSAISNGVAVVHVTQAGATKTLDTYSHSTATLAEIETRLTDRFDDVAYYAYSGAP